VLGCYGGQLLGFHLTSLLVNDSILLDAGSPTESLDLEGQFAIRHIFVSHTHLDHIKDIAFLADNRSLKRMGGASTNRQIVVHSLPENIEVMRQDFFNNRVWPNFERIPSTKDPILVFEPIEAEQTVEVEGVKVTAIEVNHPVPCTGFLVDQGDKQFIYTADTGSTDRIWEVANAQSNLKGIVVDCSFPNAYEDLAEMSGHLTPNGMARELAKFEQLGKVPVYLYHMKPETLDVLTAEVSALFLPHLRMLTQVDELLL